jgi:hypothetical protein
MTELLGLVCCQLQVETGSLGLYCPGEGAPGSRFPAKVLISSRVRTEHASIEADWADSTAPEAKAQVVAMAERRAAFFHIEPSEKH